MVSNNWLSIIEMVRRTATRKGRQGSGYFSIEGTRLHERAARARVPLAHTLVDEQFGQDPASREHDLFEALKQFGTPLDVIPTTLMTELTEGRRLGSIVSLIPQPEQPDLTAVTTQKPSPLLLVAANIIDPGNVGAMIRTGHANNIAAFIAVGHSDPFHPKAVRTTMGSLFKVPILHYKTLLPLLADLRNLNIQRVGTVSSGGMVLPKMTFAGTGTAVFMGNEYYGLPDDVLQQLDHQITIPMAEGIDSLSVNAATAVILYEINRQHKYSESAS